MNNTSVKVILLTVVTVPCLLWAAERKSIAPLLTSHWHQQAPYNGLSPVVTDGQVKTVAGCVAIAASQIAYYWRRDNPEQTLRDTPTYPYGSAPVTYSVSAGTPYNWQLMHDSYEGTESQAERDAVALLAYVVGTSAYLQYGSSTGGQINDVMYNSYYAQLRLASEYAAKHEYTQQQWEDLLYEELSHGRPILYAGNNPNAGGHAVVIDGYDAPTGLFHFNFGWGGRQDGYYTVNDVNGMDGYCSSQKCVYQIHPIHRNIEADIEFTGQLSVNVATPLQLSILNNSTLPVGGLKLFLTPTADLSGARPVAVSSQKIDNDGHRQTISMEILPSIAGSALVLTLCTDEGDVLCSKQTDVSTYSGITTPNCDAELKLTTRPEGLLITPNRPTEVAVYTVSGQCYWRQYVMQPTEVRLPIGVYIVRGRKISIR